MRSRFSPFLFLFVAVLALLPAPAAVGQTGAPDGAGTGPAKPREYTIGGLTASGIQYLDADLLIAVTGLQVGGTVRLPGDEGIARAIRNLYKQDLFADVRVDIVRFLGDKVFLNIAVEERPRLARYNFRGITKGEGGELKDRLGLRTSRVVTEAVKKDAVVRIKKFYADKGYAQTAVTIRERPDSAIANTVVLTFDIRKGAKTRINQISIAGNSAASDARLKRAMRGTTEMARISLHPADATSVYDREERSFRRYLRTGGFLSATRTLQALDPYFRYNIFKASKFNETKLEDDKQALIGVYNTLGYRDATIVDDTVYAVDNGNLNVELRVDEGRRYYFGDIAWEGNTKYSSEVLSTLLGIKRGDIYNIDLLDRRLGRQLGPEGTPDVSSIYMDDGYLFYNVNPVETRIEGDTIHYQMRITEGAQATIRDIQIRGNDRTNDHVIRRELFTLPGNKFSRQDIVRSNRQIANLGFFDAEKIGIEPQPHPEDGTVDILYTVVEKSSDQLQLSAGFGGGVRFYGNLGVQFNNFSLRNIFKPGTWDPLPVGDGQKFSVNYQSNGFGFNSLNASFTEPWLGGKKPTALTTSIRYSRFSQSAQDPSKSYLRVYGGGVSISKRLKVPDDNFVLTYGINYENFFLKDYALVPEFTNGQSNNLYFRTTIARYSVDQPLYPRSGANISFTFQATPPWGAFRGVRGADVTSAERYKFVEYHKYRFTADWYQRVAGNLVFRLAAKYGFLGSYDPNTTSPFERFQLGGNGLQGNIFFIGRDIIAQRGYEVYTDPETGQTAAGTIFNKYQAELRYPFSLNPSSTIYGLAFVDAANLWTSFKNYDPIRLNRAAGVGVRVFLPMFGMIGLDYGVGFDRAGLSRGNRNLGNMGMFTFMLGTEPD